MSFHKLAVFDSNYDGNFNLAQRLVNVRINSNNFTLTQYPGQQEFYTEFVGKYDQWYNELKTMTTSSSFQLLDTIKNALSYFQAEGTLTFLHLLFAYAYIFLFKDDYAGYRDAHRSLKLTHIERLDNNISLTDVIKLMKEYNEYLGFTNYAPFISKTGAFGFNTFFYMYLNNVVPIACALDPYPVHDDYYQGSAFGVMSHDFFHGSQVRNEVFGYDNDYFISLKHLYLQIINSTLPDQQIKGMILTLFIQIHEMAKKFRCGEPVSTIEIEQIDLMKANTYYTYDRIKNIPVRSTIQNDATYRDKFLVAVQNDICELFQVGYYTVTNKEVYIIAKAPIKQQGDGLIMTEVGMESSKNPNGNIFLFTVQPGQEITPDLLLNNQWPIMKLQRGFGTTDNFYRGNLDVTENPPFFEAYDKKWPIFVITSGSRRRYYVQVPWGKL